MKFAEIIKKFLKLLKNHKILVIIFIFLIVAFVVLTFVVSSIKETKIREQLNNKFFVAESVNSQEKTEYSFHCFKDGKYSYEDFDNYDKRSRHGDITNFENGEIIIEVSFFKNRVSIYTRKPSQHKVYRCFGTYNLLTDTLTLKDPEDGDVLTETTFDFYKETGARFFCNHENAEEIILKEATCSEDGEKIVVCDFCDYQSQEVIQSGHKYDHHICEICGNREKSSIRPNTWKTDYTIDLLKYYNCEVEMPQISGASVLLVCYPVCQKCRYTSKFPLVKNVEYGMENTSIYTCPDCNEITVVKLACYE